MLKIKKEHLGKRITNGGREIILSDSLSQKELLHIQKIISSEYVEDFKEAKKIASKPVKKKAIKNKADDKDIEESNK